VLHSPDAPAPAPGDDPVCTVTELGTCVQLTASGELDIAAAALLRDAADRATFAPGRVVLLDLCEATFVDGSVIHFAIELERRATAHRTELVIVASAATKRLFTLVGADGLRVVEDGHRRDGAGS
jgi:anti-anti-sigma regulatory factor